MGFPWICPWLMVKKGPGDSGQMCYLKSKIIGGNKYLARHNVGPDHVECTCLLDPRGLMLQMEVGCAPIEDYNRGRNVVRKTVLVGPFPPLPSCTADVVPRATTAYPS